MFIWFLFQDKVKILHLISKSAGLIKEEGTCSFHNKPFINSQRPNAGDLKWLVGFVEGDGCFSVNKNGKYVKYEFTIKIHKRDIKLLYKIKDILGGFGSITTFSGSNTSFARLKIASKDDLKRVILPIFDQYGMLTSKQYDYLYFKSCLLQNITYYSDLPTYNRPNFTPFHSYQDILNVYYFDEWLVGFMEAESYFSTFQAANDTAKGFCEGPSGTANKTSTFGISQNNGMQIITAIQKRLSLISTPYERDKKTGRGVPRTEPGASAEREAPFCVIKTSSKRGIQNTINFLKNTPVKLKENKRAQYLKWLHELRVNPRYCNLNIPNHY
uniref:Orf327 protein n=1 Tax=Dunaliella salina TaxID=3046 RepID=A0A0C5BWH7_DUNSA|nr:LAGLIDADG endonuclease [Dunaliella salina]